MPTEDTKRKAAKLIRDGSLGAFLATLYAEETSRPYSRADIKATTSLAIKQANQELRTTQPDHRYRLTREQGELLEETVKNLRKRDPELKDTDLAKNAWTRFQARMEATGQTLQTTTRKTAHRSHTPQQSHKRHRRHRREQSYAEATQSTSEKSTDSGRSAGDIRTTPSQPSRLTQSGTQTPPPPPSTAPPARPSTAPPARNQHGNETSLSSNPSRSLDLQSSTGSNIASDTDSELEAPAPRAAGTSEARGEETKAAIETPPPASSGQTQATSVTAAANQTGNPDTLKELTDRYARTTDTLEQLKNAGILNSEQIMQSLSTFYATSEELTRAKKEDGTPAMSNEQKTEFFEKRQELIEEFIKKYAGDERSGHSKNDMLFAITTEALKQHYLNTVHNECGGKTLLQIEDTRKALDTQCRKVLQEKLAAGELTYENMEAFINDQSDNKIETFVGNHSLHSISNANEIADIRAQNKLASLVKGNYQRDFLEGKVDRRKLPTSEQINKAVAQFAENNRDQFNELTKDSRKKTGSPKLFSDFLRQNGQEIFADIDSELKLSKGEKKKLSKAREKRQNEGAKADQQQAPPSRSESGLATDTTPATSTTHASAQNKTHQTQQPAQPQTQQVKKPFSSRLSGLGSKLSSRLSNLSKRTSAAKSASFEVSRVSSPVSSQQTPHQVTNNRNNKGEPSRG